MARQALAKERIIEEKQTVLLMLAQQIAARERSDEFLRVPHPKPSRRYIPTFMRRAPRVEGMAMSGS
ncbi:MAG: hypothetical protein WC670_17795 [Pseudolabrys sp.]|jgi:hypothetical protein